MYQDEPLTIAPDNAVGFVYQITHTPTGKAYIGKKLFWSTRRIKQAGKRRRKVVIKESDWRSYQSSSVELQKEIARLGADAFQFEILTLCYNKADLTYHETRLQFVLDVLTAKLPNGNPAYYNQTILGRFYRR